MKIYITYNRTQISLGKNKNKKQKDSIVVRLIIKIVREFFFFFFKCGKWIIMIYECFMFTHS